MDRFPIQWRRVGFLIGVGILVLVIVDLNARLEGLNKLNEEVFAVRVQATQAMQTQMAIHTKVAFAGSDHAVEEQARVEERKIQEGDVPVVVIGDGNPTPTPAATPTPSPTPMANWEIWWMLFFGR